MSTSIRKHQRMSIMRGFNTIDGVRLRALSCGGASDFGGSKKRIQLP